MPFRAPDPRFPSLTIHCLIFYWVVCLTTLGVTIGSVVQQVGVYQTDCSAYNNYNYDSYYGDYGYYGYYQYGNSCIPGDIVVFALGLGVAVLAMILSSVQLFLFYRHKLSPRFLSISNAVVVVPWIVVIAIGWNPTNWTYDKSTGVATPDVSGWLYTYSGSWVSEGSTAGVSATTALAMGFAVMSCISFGLATLLALYAFIVHHRNSRRQRLADKATLVTPPTMTEKTHTMVNLSPMQPAVLPTVRAVQPYQLRPNVTSVGIPQNIPQRSRSL